MKGAQQWRYMECPGTSAAKGEVERETGFDHGYAHFGLLVLDDLTRAVLDKVLTRQAADRGATRQRAADNLDDDALLAIVLPRVSRRFTNPRQVRWAANVLRRWCARNGVLIAGLSQLTWLEFVRYAGGKYSQPAVLLHYVGLLLAEVDRLHSEAPDTIGNRAPFWTYRSDPVPLLAADVVSSHTFDGGIRTHRHTVRLNARHGDAAAAQTFTCIACRRTLEKSSPRQRLCGRCAKARAEARRRAATNAWNKARRERSRSKRNAADVVLEPDVQAALEVAASSRRSDASGLRSAARRFARWCQASEVDVRRADNETLRLYAASLAMSSSASYVRSQLTYLRAWLETLGGLGQ